MRHHKPRDPDFAARVRDSFDRQGIMQLLGATLTRIEPGLVVIELPYRTNLTQQHGYFHAGVVATIGDSAGGYAAHSLMPAKSSVLTVEYKINLLAPADGEHLVATGRAIRSGRTLTVCEVEVEVQKGGARATCAWMLATLMCLENRPDRPSG
jgi:uncharacterized protein (TIGR00369 family)